MQKLVIVLTCSLTLFMVWVINMANMGSHSFLLHVAYKIPLADKMAHLFLFGLLSLGVNSSSRFKLLKIKQVKIYYGSLFIFLFALFEEISQHFIATRTLDGLDLLAGAIGIAISNIVSSHIHSKQLIRLSD